MLTTFSLIYFSMMIFTAGVLYLSILFSGNLEKEAVNFGSFTKLYFNIGLVALFWLPLLLTVLFGIRNQGDY